MKALHVLVLLVSAVLLCSAAPALEPVTCNEDNSAAAARLALHDINEHHIHGYKFRLSGIKGNKMEMVDDGCTIELHLDLLETKCPTVIPKHFEDCETRYDSETIVKANCTVMMTVKSGKADVNRYNCDTRKGEMIGMCPDCPSLISLSSLEGVNSVRKAVQKVNMNNTNMHYYVLKEVGRVLSGYIPSQGMFYAAEFVIVESHCPMGSRIVPEACEPLCPDRAHYATCRSSYTNGAGLQSVECDYYTPVNTTALGPGEQEPHCRRSHPMPPPDPVGHPDRDDDHPFIRRGPPPHAHDRRGPPPHAHDDIRGPPPHAHDDIRGPPPHAGGGGTSPPVQVQSHGPPFGVDPVMPAKVRPFFINPCNGVLPNSDPAIHPICPKPLPEPRHDAKPEQS
ncbi:alpha-2-HS-glycoprotein 1 [Paralichthys olivaceus]|uniref:alpha-2-HS-glycoprotein 1 n=1 Tax=Paralichthys olivaceus TaxID=8255 RepID=UPI00375204BD